MINSGLYIKPFDGNQAYNDTDQTWVGVSVNVNYSTDQDGINNPPSIGDYVVEPDGEVWIVQNVTVNDPANGDFTLEVKGHYDSSSNTSPNFGNVNRGSIMTPINGVLAPHWDPTKVSSAISRIVAILNAELQSYGSKNASDITEGVFSETTIPELPTNKIIGLDIALSEKASQLDIDTINSTIASLEQLVSSDDVNLDEMQEIVNFIKANKSTLDTLGISNISGLQTALDSKQESLVSGTNVKTINGETVLGSGDIALESGVNRIDIDVTSFASLAYTAPSGITVTKEYSDSSLKITHNQGMTPSGWLVINKESNPPTQIVQSSTVNMQVVDSNTIILTNLSSFEILEIVLNF